jgi:hypothetical protein
MRNNEEGYMFAAWMKLALFLLNLGGVVRDIAAPAV